MKIRTDNLPSAVALRAAAVVWGEAIKRSPVDGYDSACKRAWLALETAAIAHARAKVLR